MRDERRVNTLTRVAPAPTGWHRFQIQPASTLNRQSRRPTSHCEYQDQSPLLRHCPHLKSAGTLATTGWNIEREKGIFDQVSRSAFVGSVRKRCDTTFYPTPRPTPRPLRHLHAVPKYSDQPSEIYLRPLPKPTEL